MIVKLPTLTRKFDEESKTVVTEKSFIEVEIDTSFKAHLKWEEHFQKTMGFSLAQYTEMVRGWIKDPDTARAYFIGLLKLLYCYVNSSKLPTFLEFAGLFEMGVVDEILSKIGIILEEVGRTASKN